MAAEIVKTVTATAHELPRSPLQYAFLFIYPASADYVGFGGASFHTIVLLHMLTVASWRSYYTEGISLDNIQVGSSLANQWERCQRH